MGFSANLNKIIKKSDIKNIKDINAEYEKIKKEKEKRKSDDTIVKFKISKSIYDFLLKYYGFLNYSSKSDNIIDEIDFIGDESNIHNMNNSTKNWFQKTNDFQYTSNTFITLPALARAYTLWHLYGINLLGIGDQLDDTISNLNKPNL